MNYINLKKINFNNTLIKFINFETFKNRSQSEEVIFCNNIDKIDEKPFKNSGIKLFYIMIYQLLIKFYVYID